MGPTAKHQVAQNFFRQKHDFLDEFLDGLDGQFRERCSINTFIQGQ
jgi:hypothetical protein